MSFNKIEARLADVSFDNLTTEMNSAYSSDLAEAVDNLAHSVITKLFDEEIKKSNRTFGSQEEAEKFKVEELDRIKKTTEFSAFKIVASAAFKRLPQFEKEGNRSASGGRFNSLVKGNIPVMTSRKGSIEGVFDDASFADAIDGGNADESGDNSTASTRRNSIVDSDLVLNDSSVSFDVKKINIKETRDSIYEAIENVLDESDIDARIEEIVNQVLQARILEVESKGKADEHFKKCIESRKYKALCKSVVAVARKMVGPMRNQRSLGQSLLHPSSVTVSRRTQAAKNGDRNNSPEIIKK